MHLSTWGGVLTLCLKEHQASKEEQLEREGKDLLSGKDSEMEKGRSGAGEGGKSWMCGQEMSGRVSGHHAPFEWRLQ